MNVASGSAPIASGSASRAPAQKTQADPHARHAHAPGDGGGTAAQAKRPSTDGVELSREGKASALSTAAVDADKMRVTADLKARDREVRAHEAAHKAAAGRYAGAVRLDFTTGPDGQQYAVGGEVSIDTAPIAGDPEATIEKMRTIQAAAMAPTKPSAADRAVAAKAAQMALDARIEADRMASEKSKAEGDVSRSPGDPPSSSPYSTTANDAVGQILSLLA